MKRHLAYWWARIRNDFLRLAWLGPTEEQFVEEVMTGLRRDKKLAELMDEKQREIDAEGGR